MRWWWLLAAAACGKGGDGDDTGSGFPRACDQSGLDGDCILFDGSKWVASDVTDSCSGGGDVVDACPSNAAIGTCTLDADQPSRTTTTFYSPFWTAAQGAGQCQGSGGTWEQAD